MTFTVHTLNERMAQNDNNVGHKLQNVTVVVCMNAVADPSAGNEPNLEKK